MEKNFETYEDYLNFLKSIEGMLNELTWNGKRKITSAPYHKAAAFLKIYDHENYIISIRKATEMTLTEL